ncbi:rab11 family-interacting protein 4A isoform X4 [Magallana gigas]|uniref:rab11 family-interacting protein 4A isoform X4 n=1 Tax=Magallana gigas TaxID=29159 RepID=UPI0005C37942|eukprot:XP_011454116.1 PREDICTED: rab11 family-interacting protein 4A isoform X4 [Crassostrea gigas]
MEEDVLEKLRTVFNVCDERNEGYISVEHFKDLAKEHFGQFGDDEKIVGIIQILDPEGKGKINFEDFCEGVQQINELQVPLSPISPVNSPFQIPSISSSNNNLLLNGLDDFIAGDVSSTECPETSEASAYTYNEYDTNTDEDGHGQGILIDLSTPEPVRRNLHPTPNGRLDFTDEENYEDFGEVDDIESDMSDPSQNRSRDSIHKVRTRRGDKHHRKSFGQRSRVTTSAAYASQLQNKSRTEPGDEILDDIDGNFQTLNDRVQFLEKKLVQISEEKSSVNTSHSKLKDENSHLMESIVDRIHSLEEQLKDVEVKSKETLAEEQKKFKQMLSRAETEKAEQMYIAQRLQSIEKEYEVLKIENPRLRLEIDKLRVEKLDLQDKLTDVQAEYNAVYSEHEELKQKFEKERQCTGTLLDELGKELEELRKYKIDHELNQSPRPRNNSMADLPGRYQALNSEVNRLKEALSYEWRNLSQENKQLQDMNEDLNAQLLTRCINEGKTLVNDTKAKSLATELEHLTKEELMAKLQEVECVNINLKSYVDKIILTILEKNPSILEITNR